MGLEAGADGPEVLDWDQGATPRSLAGLATADPPYHGWVCVAEKRLYLSWGEDSFVLVHPFAPPAVTDHVADRWMLEAIARSTAPIAVWGPAGVGKSLFLALYAQVLADGGDRVLVLSGIPTHDLGDGREIHHGVLDPVFDLTAARTLIARWRPNAVLVDHDPCADLGILLRDCWMAGSRLAVTLRAGERAQAVAALDALAACRKRRGLASLRPSSGGSGAAPRARGPGAVASRPAPIPTLTSHAPWTGVHWRSLRISGGSFGRPSDAGSSTPASSRAAPSSATRRAKLGRARRHGDLQEMLIGTDTGIQDDHEKTRQETGR